MYVARCYIASIEAAKPETLPMMDREATRNITGPVSNDTIARNDIWQSASQASDKERREACNGWDAKV